MEETGRLLGGVAASGGSGWGAGTCLGREPTRPGQAVSQWSRALAALSLLPGRGCCPPARRTAPRPAPPHLLPLCPPRQDPRSRANRSPQQLALTPSGPRPSLRLTPPPVCLENRSHTQTCTPHWPCAGLRAKPSSCFVLLVPVSNGGGGETPLLSPFCRGEDRGPERSGDWLGAPVLARASRRRPQVAWAASLFWPADGAGPNGTQRGPGPGGAGQHLAGWPAGLQRAVGSWWWGPSPLPAPLQAGAAEFLEVLKCLSRPPAPPPGQLPVRPAPPRAAGQLLPLPPLRFRNLTHSPGHPRAQWPS